MKLLAEPIMLFDLTHTDLINNRIIFTIFRFFNYIELKKITIYRFNRDLNNAIFDQKKGRAESEHKNYKVK